MGAKRPTSIEVAYAILCRTKRPMTPKELVELGFSKHGLVMKGMTPDATLNANFINEIKRRRRDGREQRFVRVRPGHWGLVQFLGRYYHVD